VLVFKQGNKTVHLYTVNTLGAQRLLEPLQPSQAPTLYTLSLLYTVDIKSVHTPVKMIDDDDDDGFSDVKTEIQ